MNIFKKLLKWIGYILLLPIIYFALSLLCTYITIDRKVNNPTSEKIIYLNTNGIHLDIVLPISAIDTALLSGIENQESAEYLSFGWGDENFYLYTPTWKDLTFNNAFTALFLKSSTLMHVTRYPVKQEKWVRVNISQEELDSLNAFIEKAFSKKESGNKIILNNKGYNKYDDFYKANGSYSALNTCNSWVNLAFKESGMKACFWTPFDFGLLQKYSYIE